jgi:DNA-binding GntR family transcriptional regulator
MFEVRSALEGLAAALLCRVSNMSVPRHQTLVDAAAAGDPDRARAAVEEHMRGAATTLITEFNAKSRDTA